MKIKIKAPHPSVFKSVNPTFAEPIDCEVEAEMVGDVLIYKSPTSDYWIAKNERTGKITNNAERAKAIKDAQ